MASNPPAILKRKKEIMCAPACGMKEKLKAIRCFENIVLFVEDCFKLLILNVLRSEPAHGYCFGIMMRL